MVEACLYRVRIRFEKLFADPTIFDEPSMLARRYLISTGLKPGEAASIYQTTKDVFPVDDRGNPSLALGTAKFSYQGKMLRSEYMSRANIDLDYVDFGSGHSPREHESLWRRGRWGDMKFEVAEFRHHPAKIELPDVGELYQMLRARADPSTLATVELPDLGKSLFEAAVRYVEDRLEQKSKEDGGSVEVYAARDLASEERRALERRLGRESTDNTVYVILSRELARPRV